MLTRTNNLCINPPCKDDGIILVQEESGGPCEEGREGVCTGGESKEQIYCSKLSGIEVGFYSNHSRPGFIQPDVVLLACLADHHSLFAPGLAPSLWGKYLKS